MSVESGTPSAQGTGPYHRLRVARVIEETHDSKSIVLDVPSELAERFAYRAGQFLTFRVEVADQRLVRCYSLASAPGIERGHKVTVKRVVDGRASNWLNDNVREGSELEVMPPNGIFCLRDRETPIVLFAGGSGITPVISILKIALQTTSRPVKLLYANRDDRSILFKEELAGLLREHPGRLEIVHRLDDVHGFVDAALVVQEVGPRRDADFYICGPGPFMDVVESGLGSLSIGADQIFIERFESPDTPMADAGPVDTSAGNRVTVLLDGEETEIELGEGETILAAARRIGLEPPFACEEAYCGCCMAKVVEGEVEMRMNDGGINQLQIDRGWVLTCQGLAKGKVRVEYPD
ncbi:MAG: 3-ketosteroid-9-alpha-hydroxylase [Deltaproteobacteria bacterium]|nr:3-ketosteroid-9-alpha-hydroxylase [Deltaproteobacteria bacterium]